MKRLLVCTAALGLLASVPASAQENDHHGDKHDAAGSSAGHTAASAGAHQSDQGRERQDNRAMTSGTHTKSVGVHPNTAAEPSHMRSIGTNQNAPAVNTTANRFLPASGDSHPIQAGRSTAARGQNNSAWSGNAGGRPPAVNSRQGGSNWSGDSHRLDVNALRRNVQATQRFRGGNYSAPQGYQFRHWSYGERLPRGYFVRNYWIANFVMYGLFAPPSDLIWVRVGDDALLVDQESGDIVQVRYGVFY